MYLPERIGLSALTPNLLNGGGYLILPMRARLEWRIMSDHKIEPPPFRTYTLSAPPLYPAAPRLRQQLLTLFLSSQFHAFTFVDIIFIMTRDATQTTEVIQPVKVPTLSFVTPEVTSYFIGECLFIANRAFCNERFSGGLCWCSLEDGRESSREAEDHPVCLAILLWASS